MLPSVSKIWLRYKKKNHNYISKISSKINQLVYCLPKLYIGIVESRGKGFLLDLKLLFIIVDCFQGRFPPKFFTAKLVYFIGFPGLSYLVLFIFLLHNIDMILIFVCFNKVY